MAAGSSSMAARIPGASTWSPPSAAQPGGSPTARAPGISSWPSASADGSKIVFGYAPSYNTNLWAMNVDPASGTVTGEPRPLTGGLVDRAAPYPSPDGKRIAYKAISGRTQEIRV